MILSRRHDLALTDEKPNNVRADVFSREKSVEDLQIIIKKHVLENGENVITLIGIKKKGYNDAVPCSGSQVEKSGPVAC